MLTVLITEQEILLVYMMVSLLKRESVEEKEIDLSLSYAPYPYDIICQDESHNGTGGCNKPL